MLELINLLTFTEEIVNGNQCFFVQSEYGKMRTRITPNTDTFYAVEVKPWALQPIHKYEICNMRDMQYNTTSIFKKFV